MRPSLVITAAMAAGLATASYGQDSVSIYGVVGTQFVYAHGADTLKKLDPNSIVTPRLGFKGSEDLGDGLRAVFDLESQLLPDTGMTGSPFWSRGSWVGLQGTMGSVKLGRQWNLNDDLLCGLYVCGGYAAFYNFAGFGSSSDLANNAVKYTLPDFHNGLAGGVMVAPGEGSGRYAGTAGTYSAGGLTVGVGYDQKRNSSGSASDKLLLLGGKYVFGDAFVRLAYADAKPDASALGKATAYDVGAGYSFSSPLSVSLDYVAMDRKNSPDDTRFVRLVGIYNLSKRTSLNANIIRLSNKGASAVALAGGTVNPGGSQTVITGGIAHSF